MNGYRKFTGALFKVNDVISKVELLLMSISMVILTAVMSWQVLTRYFIGIPATWAEPNSCQATFSSKITPSPFSSVPLK